ncbi:MAG: hypothetical protein GY934_14520, partial [Gammaproteobacteria bacterium]|nr:hypothetical protein [Gammaproteobacteria bacterium]
MSLNERRRNAFWILSAGFLILSALTTTPAIAQSLVMDHIERKLGTEKNEITIIFNVPVRYISHLTNSSNNEVAIRVQPVITPGQEEDFLGQEQTLGWKPSAEIPMERVTFQGRLIGNSNLLLSFSAPIGSYSIRQKSGFFSMTIVLNKEKQVESIVVDQPTGEETGVPETSLTPSQPLPIPSSKTRVPVDETGKFVINLLSQRTPIDFGKVPPVPIPPGLHLYTTEATVDDKKWYRLRIGFIKTKQEATRINKEIRHFYSASWVDIASNSEKEQFIDGFTDKDKTPPARLPKQDFTPPSDRQTTIIAKAREIMKAGDYPKAVLYLTALLDGEESVYSQEARELLGLARERNGQIAHAKAEYRKYLEEYPEGEDAERVKQRLTGLITAAQKPKTPLRKQTRIVREEEASWDVYGDFSQIYRSVGIDSDFTDELTTQELANNLNLTARRRSSDSETRFQMTTSYDYDILNNGADDNTSLSDAYLDYDSLNGGYFGRIGRQRLRSSGLLGRFDGAVAGYRITTDHSAQIYAGFPVESSNDMFIQEDKVFIGANYEMLALYDQVDVTLFAVEQQNEGMVDRRILGLETRYFDEKRSFYALMDYDIFHNELATFLVQTNFSLEDASSIYVNFDYRNSPALATSNALLEQTATTLDELSNSFSDEEIYQLAKDRTAQSRVLSVGGTKILPNEIQLSGDITYSHTSGTSASGGVTATESTGNEFFYTFQVLKNNLLKNGDIGIFNLRYADAKTTDTIAMTVNSRYPITSLWRVSPKLLLSYRKNKDIEGDRLTTGGVLQAEYRIRNNLTLDLDAG